MYLTFPTREVTRRSAQLQQMAKHLQFQIHNLEILSLYEGGSIYHGNVPIDRKALYLYALQSHSQDDRLLD